MTSLTVFADAKLPTASTIQGLRSLQTNSVASGTTILKMDKTGYWVFGADSTDIDPETVWAINPSLVDHFKAQRERIIAIKQEIKDKMRDHAESIGRNTDGDARYRARGSG